MSKEKIILTDADGVLLFWLQGFLDFMKDKGFTAIPDTENLWSMSKRFGISSEEAQEYIREFNEGPSIGKLGPYLDAVEYVTKLANHGFKFFVITSVSKSPLSEKYRTENLISIFGDIFSGITCLEMGEPKGEALKAWEGTGYFWIEDHVKNANAGKDLGLKSILICQDHNVDFDTSGLQTVGPDNPWKEIYNIITTEYGF